MILFLRGLQQTYLNTSIYIDSAQLNDFNFCDLTQIFLFSIKHFSHTEMVYMIVAASNIEQVLKTTPRKAAVQPPTPHH